MCSPEPRRSSPVRTESSSLQFIKTSVGFKEPLPSRSASPPLVSSLQNFLFFIYFEPLSSSAEQQHLPDTSLNLHPQRRRRRAVTAFLKWSVVLWLFILFNGPETSSFHVQLKFPSIFFFINYGSLCFHFLSIFSLENFFLKWFPPEKAGSPWQPC